MLVEPATAILGGSGGSRLIDKVLEASAEPQIERAVASSSVTVLPFVNMSPDSENEYFCDGLGETLIANNNGKGRPAFDTIRDDIRFGELIGKIGFPA